MALSREEILRLADLSRLSLGEEEIQRMSETIDPVLSFVGRLANVDTTGIPESEDEGGVVLRVDVAHSASQDERQMIVSNFPDRMGDALRVPGVFEKPKG